MKIALAQINTSMGAIESNCAKISDALEKTQEAGVDLTIFPELSVIGYPPMDLLEQEGFLERSSSALESLAQKHPHQSWIVGTAMMSPPPGKGRQNAAVVVQQGRVVFSQGKRLLPTYDVFDENRYFDAAVSSEMIEIGGKRLGLTICEDIWTSPELLGRRLYREDPVKDLAARGAQVILNISASPYHTGKERLRFNLAREVVEKTGVPLVYVNLVGGNDELLFDGGSFALDAKGEILARASVFEEDLVFVDLRNGVGTVRTWPEQTEEWQSRALIMGLQDYVAKCGFKKVMIGLSGGIDSSLVAMLAVKAFGPENVTGVSMPSNFTSSMSREDAEAMAKALDISLKTIPIEPVMASYEAALADAFSGRPKDVTEENIQARIRGNMLMALSNKFGHLVLSTGNKSELAVGYCTQYGDMAGGLAAISDLPKMDVYRVARYLNQSMKAIPDRVFTRPPTAELRDNQKDSDSLPPYEVLDSILKMYVEEGASAERIIKTGHEVRVVERVIQMVDRNEFKRRQAAPGLRLSGKAFGRGRRMPIARGAA